MSVQISELDVVPRPAPPRQPEGPQQEQGGGGSGQGTPSPEQAREIARTIAVLKDRDLRLRAD